MVKLSLQEWRYFLPRLWLAAVAIFLLYYEYYSDEATMEARKHSTRIVEHIDHFKEAWCRVRRARLDSDAPLKSCSFNISWNGNSPNRRQQTDASKSFISFFDVRPAGEFSRFIIRTKTKDSELKLVGGDSWRILLRGPATISPTTFDHRNGTYEVLFLAMEPGVYKLDITLDYSLCDGYRDPPSDWFIVGNAQGKMQKTGVLGTRAKDDFLLQPFQNGKLIMINVAMPRDGGIFLMNKLPDRPCLSSKFDLSCGIKCNFVWDGFGRWLGRNWKPYLTEIPSYFDPKSSEVTKNKMDTLWIYGDSQAERLYQSIREGPLCTRLFRACNMRKLWVYPYEGEIPPWDDKDFEDQRIIDDLRGIFEKLEITGHSVMILNLGLHYMESVNLQEYKTLLMKLLDLLNERDETTGALKYNTRVIWKTSTSISKEKDTGDQLRSDRRRFLTLPRVNLYNALATSMMCRAGLEILDIYPFTRSYPEGTGGPEVAFYKEHDIVHFKYFVMKYFDVFLEDYFLGKVQLPINLNNYKFS